MPAGLVSSDTSFLFFFFFWFCWVVYALHMFLQLPCTGSVLEAHGLSSLEAGGIWVHQPGIEPVPLALEGRFITTGLLGKSLRPLSLTYHWLSSPCPHAVPSVYVRLLIPSSHDNNSHTKVQSSPLIWPHNTLIASSKALCPNTVTFLDTEA